METIRRIHNRVHTLYNINIIFLLFRLVWGAFNDVPEHEHRIIALDVLLLILIIVNIFTTKITKKHTHIYRGETISG